MKVTVTRTEGDYFLEASNEEGRKVYMDAAESMGGTNKAARPMQLLLMALGGCSAFDIIMILNKQKIKVDDISIDVNGEREEVNTGAAPFKDIQVTFRLQGNIPEDKARKAVALSMDKYCSVSKTLEKTAVITYRIILNGNELTPYANKDIS